MERIRDFWVSLRWIPMEFLSNQLAQIPLLAMNPVLAVITRVDRYSLLCLLI